MKQLNEECINEHLCNISTAYTIPLVQLFWLVVFFQNKMKLWEFECSVVSSKTTNHLPVLSFWWQGSLSEPVDVPFSALYCPLHSPTTMHDSTGRSQSCLSSAAKITTIREVMDRFNIRILYHPHALIRYKQKIEYSEVMDKLLQWIFLQLTAWSWVSQWIKRLICNRSFVS